MAGGAPLLDSAVRLIVRVVSWIFGDIKKEGSVLGTVIIVGGILDW